MGFLFFFGEKGIMVASFLVLRGHQDDVELVFVSKRICHITILQIV